MSVESEKFYRAVNDATVETIANLKARVAELERERDEAREMAVSWKRDLDAFRAALVAAPPSSRGTGLDDKAEADKAKTEEWRWRCMGRTGGWVPSASDHKPAGGENEDVIDPMGEWGDRT